MAFVVVVGRRRTLVGSLLAALLLLLVGTPGVVGSRFLRNSNTNKEITTGEVRGAGLFQYVAVVWWGCPKMGRSSASHVVTDEREQHRCC
jgi:hypothetical protein